MYKKNSCSQLIDAFLQMRAKYQAELETSDQVVMV